MSINIADLEGAQPFAHAKQREFAFSLDPLGDRDLGYPPGVSEILRSLTQEHADHESANFPGPSRQEQAAGYVGQLVGRLQSMRYRAFSGETAPTTHVSTMLTTRHDVAMSAPGDADDLSWQITAALPLNPLDHGAAVLLYGNSGPRRVSDIAFVLELDSSGFVNMGAGPAAYGIYGIAEVANVPGFEEALTADVAILTAPATS